MKTESGKGGEGGGLVEHVQVSECELKLDRLIDLQNSLFMIIMSKLDWSWPNFSFYCKLDKVSVGSDGNSLWD